MLTKTVYQYLGNDVIIAGVYDWLFKEDSGLLGILPRKTVRDNGVKYNVETTYPVATWTDVNDVIPESAGAFEQRSAALYNLIHDIDIDKSQIAKDKTQNKEAVEIMRQMRGFLNTWQNAFIFGQTSTSSSTKQCKGLLRLLAEIEGEDKTDLDGATDTGGNNSQFVCTGDNTALTLAAVEILADACKLGVDAYLMSRKARRYLNTLARSSGILMQVEKDAWEHNLQMFNGAKIYINDHLTNNFADASSSVLAIADHTQSTADGTASYDNTIIFALNLSDDGVHIIQTGDIDKEPPFTVPNKDAWRHRVKWYNGLAVYNKFALAGLFCLPAAS